MKSSIKTKIVLAIGIPLLATYLGMMGLEYYLGKRAALANMESSLRQWSTGQATALEAQLARAEELAGTLATLATASPDLTEDQIKTWLRESVRANPGVFGMAMAFEREAFSAERRWFAPYCCRAGRDGRDVRYLNIADAVGDYTRLDWYRPAQTTRESFWTEPYFDTGVGQRMMCTHSVPFFKDQKLRGVVTVDVLTRDLLDDVDPIDVDNAYWLLVSRRGTFISHPDLALVMRESIFNLAEREDSQAMDEAGRQMVAGEEGVRRIADRDDAPPAWVVFAPVKTAGWSLAAVLPEREVLAPIYARLARFLGILVVGCMVTLSIVLFMSARVTRPINRLTSATESLAGGNLETRVPDVAGHDEVARLSRTFNTMVADLKRNVEGRIREETARKAVEGELRAAREIQETLLPAMLPPDRDRPFLLHALNAPAKMVAGDFFDFFFVDHNRLALVMADVSGKGIPAAIYMAVTRTKLRDFASPDKSPAQTVAEVNRCLARDNDRNMFVTLFFGYYDVSSGELLYVNAGHNPPYLVTKNGEIRRLEPTGPLVGPFADAEFHDGRTQLGRRDLLVLYTDGVTEAMSPDGKLFGDERLETLLQSMAFSKPAEACEGVTQAVHDFSPGDLSDDATLLALTRLR